MNSFDPSKLGGGRGSPQPSSPRPERLFLVVETYETPDDGFHFAVGRRLDDPSERVRVRLNTVSERAADRPNESVEKIKTQYVSAELHRGTIADKAKANVPLVSFDDARQVESERGIAEYRAHWPKTMSTDPQAEALVGVAHIRLRDAIDLEGANHKPAQAYIELLKGSAKATAYNIDEALVRGLSVKDEQGRARDPLVILRVMYEGKQVAAPRIYPATERTQVFDQALRDYKHVSRKLDAAVTIDGVMTPRIGHSDFDTHQLDTARALIAGIKNLEEPQFEIADQGVRGRLRNLYYGARQGAFEVEVVAAEKIDFGAKSRQSYLADKDRTHLAAFDIREENGDQQLKVTAGYTETVLAVLRHPDGEPYAVFASPADMYPRMTKLADWPLYALPQMELASDAMILDAMAKQSAPPTVHAADPVQEATEPALIDDDDMVPY